MFLARLKACGIICRQGEAACLVPGLYTTYDIAKVAIAAGTTLSSLFERRGAGESVDLVALAAEGKLGCPVRHPDPAHTYLTHTGLNHMGQASARDKMHADTAGMSHSMKTL